MYWCTLFCQMSLKSVNKFLRYVDYHKKSALFQWLFDPCDLDIWCFLPVMERSLVCIALHHHVKFDWNRSITSWDILITAKIQSFFNCYLTPVTLTFERFILLQIMSVCFGLHHHVKFHGNQSITYWDILITARYQLIFNGHLTPVTLTCDSIFLLSNLAWFVLVYTIMPNFIEICQ